MIEKPNMTAWERLQNPLNTFRGSKYCFSARHMPYLLKKLRTRYTASNTQYVGALDVSNAETIKSHILLNFTPDAVNWAHEACVRDYQIHNPRASSTKPRMNMQTGQVEDAPEVENALFEDDTPRDQAWLDEQVNNKPDTAMAAAMQKAEGAKNITKSDLANYVTKPELVSMHNEIKLNFNAVGRTFEQVDKSLRAAYADVEALKAKVDAFEQAKPTIIELKKPEQAETIKLGVQHRQFPILLAMARARENIWVYGPAGTGKSTAGEMLAVALFNNKDKFFTNGKMENQFEVLGYRNAAGVYQTTQFREAYEHGGIYMADEIDGSMPSAVLALNGALANGHCPFPDKTVARHPDFVFIGAANTTGMGGTIEYVGRMKHDAAFLDRFVTLDWPLDEGLEDAITPNKKWLGYVRYVRNRLEQNPIKGHLITPRASIKGSNLLSYGVAPEAVVKSCLQKGLSDTQWKQIACPWPMEF